MIRVFWLAPVRHKNYGAIDAILPTLIANHTERANADADFQYIWDQKALAEDINGTEQLPLNQQARVAQREDQETQYLAIENTRRKAKGLETLLSLDEMVDTAEDNGDAESDEGSESMDDEDALITETARILVDAINLSGPVMAKASVR